MEKVNDFTNHLRSVGLAESTVRAYTYAAGLYEGNRGKSLTELRTWLGGKYSVRAANLRIIGINRYLAFTGSTERMRTFRVQGRQFLDKVISDGEYRRLKRRLKATGNTSLYLAVWTMAATGARISELLAIRAEHYRQGHIDIVSKGCKMRRIYIPSKLCAEAVRLCAEGSPFTNRYGDVITARGLARQIKRHAVDCGIDPIVAHPHAFRHRFALNFLAHGGDLAMLADLLGHSSIETTRIYLRRTSAEQAAIIDRLVDW